jgi:glycosyltransferase involved in cell wall biosynthesis
MRRIHIVNPFRNPFGGSEQRALDLYRRLEGRAETALWSTEAPHAELAGRFPIAPLPQAPPPGGTWVIVGAYFETENLFARMRPRRLIYLYNTPSPNLFRKRLELARHLTGIAPEIVYAAEEDARRIGLPGRVEASPLDLGRFHPARREGRREGRRQGRGDGGFVVGRLSRDVPEKHHRDDAALYREALRRGWTLRLMGASCLVELLPPEDFARLELLPCGAEPPEVFLAGLDAFYYRVSDAWTEAFGRVVLEAMASGLPVVCDRRVGAARLIDDRRDGFVTADAGGALAAMTRLHDDPALRAAIGAAARRKAEAVYSDAYAEDLVAYYTA